MGGNHEGEDPFPLMTKKHEVDRFARAYGIDLNAVEIFDSFTRWDADAKRRVQYFSKDSPLTSSPLEKTTVQTSFEFGPRSNWPSHNRE